MCYIIWDTEERMRIAVLDAGFYHVNSLPAFDSLNAEGRIVFTRDFVNPNADIYQEHTHGMIVLSAMAGNIPGNSLAQHPKQNTYLSVLRMAHWNKSLRSTTGQPEPSGRQPRG